MERIAGRSLARRASAGASVSGRSVQRTNSVLQRALPGLSGTYGLGAAQTRSTSAPRRGCHRDKGKTLVRSVLSETSVALARSVRYLADGTNYAHRAGDLSARTGE